MTALLVLATRVALAQAEAAPPDLATLLERVFAYAESYEQALGTVVCRERYSQKVSRGGRVRQKRDLVSDFFLLFFPNRHSIGFRDVEEVDGRPVRDRAKRLRWLFESGGAVNPSVALYQSARYNIGKVYHTVSSPTFPLLYLQRTNSDKVQFRIESSGTSEGRTVVQLQCQDSLLDTLVHDLGGRPVPALGVASVDAESGRVLSLRLVLRNAALHLGAEVEVRFAPDDRLSLWLPVQMRERYWREVQPKAEVVECVATYSDFARVSVDTREWYRAP